MEKTTMARVFMSGRSQHVTIPHQYRFRTSEVSIRRDSRSGDIILSEGPGPWTDVFATLDAADVPDAFLSKAERDRRPPLRRRALESLFAKKPVPRRKRR